MTRRPSTNKNNNSKKKSNARGCLSLPLFFFWGMCPCGFFFSQRTENSIHYIRVLFRDDSIVSRGGRETVTSTTDPRLQPQQGHTHTHTHTQTRKGRKGTNEKRQQERRRRNTSSGLIDTNQPWGERYSRRQDKRVNERANEQTKEETTKATIDIRPSRLLPLSLSQEQQQQ